MKSVTTIYTWSLQMKRMVLTGAALISMAAAQAQFTYNYLKAADGYYQKGDYYSAAQYYEKYLGVGAGHEQGYSPYTSERVSKKGAAKATTSKEQAIYNLAECYRLLNYPSKAEPFYGQALDFDKTTFPLAQYRYAVTERELTNYAEAEKAFSAFLNAYKGNDTYALSATKELQNLHFIQQELKKDTRLYSVNKISSTQADTGTSYAPVWEENNTFLFTSTRPYNAADKYVNRVYQAVYTGSGLNDVNAVAIPQAANIHQGAVSLTPDGKTLFLTRWSTINGKKVASIWSSAKTAAGWSEPIELDSIVNSIGFSAQQPFMVPDGKHLLYSSNKVGGLGGFDLWYAELNAAGKPVSSVNLGSGINTAFDEQAPYYHATSGTLVFASNGRTGMGGYDLFFAKGSANTWSGAENFGYPINSVKDDIYFTSKPGAKNILEDVLISSDRSSLCCLDLFYVKKQHEAKRISGIVVACDTKAPLAGAVVSIVDTISGRIVFTQTTGSDGSYTFVEEDYEPLKAVATAKEYKGDSLHFNAPVDEDVATLTNRALCLDKAPVEVPEVGELTILNIYFDLDKANPQERSFAELDKLITMLNGNPGVVIEVRGHTDNLGSARHNKSLSDARAKSVMAYLVSKGIAKDRVTAKGFGSTVPVAANKNADGTDNPEGRQLNRRTEYRIVKK